MRTQRVVFTALPQGLQGARGGKELRLLAFISPRLYTDEGLPVPELGQFPDFVDWPSTPITWAVQFDDQPAVPVTLNSGPPDPAAWKAVFSVHSYLRPYHFPSFNGRVVRSYPHDVVYQYITGLYTKVAGAAPVSFPERRALLAPAEGRPGLKAIAFGWTTTGPNGSSTKQDTEAVALGAIDAFLNGSKVARAADLEEIAAESGVTGPSGIAMLQVKRFLQPRTPPPAGGNFSDLEPLPPPAPPGSTVPPGHLEPNILDFHQVLAGMIDHGGLQRALGLVVELVVPIPSGPYPSTVRLVPSWTPKLPEVPNKTSTVTLAPYTLLGPDGWAAPRLAGTRASAGHMQFNLNTYFAPVLVDTDGAALKLLDLAGSLQSTDAGGAATDGTSTNSSLPSLRQAGISVAQLDRAWALANPGTGLLANAESMNSGVEASPPVDPVIGIEDVMLGIRVDIYDKRRDQWYQLCARSAPDAYGDRGAPAGYVLGVGPTRVTVPVTPGSEGHVATVTTSASTQNASSELYLHETLFRWDGWSLVGSRPGKTLGEGPQSPVSEQAMNPPAPNTKFPVQIDYVATPGTLPSLRFGRAYRARARIADLGGGGPIFRATATPGSFEYATADITYGRFEPVPPPVLLMRAPVSEGERVERLVIRSNYDIADDRPGSRSPRIAPCTRHVVAPSSAELLAEQHGAFDRFERLDASFYSLIKERANATIGGVGANRPTKDPGLPSQQGAGQTSGLYYDTDELTVPYIPDVLARSAAFSDLPGAKAGQVVQVPFLLPSDRWPESSSFELRIAGEGQRPPTLVSTGGRHVLTVSVPKAEEAEIRVSSAFVEADLEVLGLWNWFKEEGTATTELKTAALNGLVWLLTPPRRVVLVHAVRQPLAAPAFSPKFSIERQAHATTAVLSDPAVSVHRASSVKVDVGARWDEWVDNGKNANPEIPVPTAARVGEVALATSGLDTEPLKVVQRFHDTRARQVSYALTATTRFAGYFVEKVTVRLQQAPVRVEPGGVMAGSMVVTGMYQGKEHTFLNGEDYQSNDAAGTLTRLPKGKLTKDQDVTVAFVPLPVARSSLEGRPEGYLGVLKQVPSTAPPAAPKVLYAVPAWSFTGPSRNTDGLHSKRLGGTLRVYLNRPWWSSGGGEQLGVLLADPEGGSVEPYYTQWGADPVWKGSSTTSVVAPTTANFPLTVAKVDTGIVVNNAGGTYGMAVHDVHFDPDRDLWYSDIQMTADPAYFPFVRLALIRYQRNAIPGAQFSGVVVADCAQTVPTRSTVVDLSVAGSIKVSVTGAWYQSASSSGDYVGPNVGPGFMYAQVERQTPGLSDELSWLPVGDEVALTSTAQTSSPGLTVWSGTITSPKTSGAHRLVVWEQESWPSTVPIGRLSPRVVYFDAIPI